MTIDEVKAHKNAKVDRAIPSMEEYYAIEDSCCRLELLRAYQMFDIFGKFKLF